MEEILFAVIVIILIIIIVYLISLNIENFDVNGPFNSYLIEGTDPQIVVRGTSKSNYPKGFYFDFDNSLKTVNVNDIKSVTNKTDGYKYWFIKHPKYGILRRPKNALWPKFLYYNASNGKMINIESSLKKDQNVQNPNPNFDYFKYGSLKVMRPKSEKRFKWPNNVYYSGRSKIIILDPQEKIKYVSENPNYSHMWRFVEDSSGNVYRDASNIKMRPMGWPLKYYLQADGNYIYLNKPPRKL